jgi:hypothetical protein|tara:strand:- start:176 stop:895 length:720 start_codon:yes stop_codon:yes gene_type:complete
MARLSTYGIDAKPELQDKVIGTDTSPGANLRTKNYSLQEIVDLFNQGNSLGVADQTIYRFQSDISQGRETGTISFIAGGGVGNPFAATTTLLISKTAAGGGNIANFLALFNGKDIILAETKNINNFGRYKISSIADYVPDANFLEITLDVTASNGVFAIDGYYIFSEFQNPSTSGDSSFAYTQAVAEDTWNIQHNMGKFPSITVIDTANTVVTGQYTYIDNNNVTLNFSAAFAGKAYLN